MYSCLSESIVAEQFLSFCHSVIILLIVAAVLNLWNPFLYIVRNHSAERSARKTMTARLWWLQLALFSKPSLAVSSSLGRASLRR